MNLDICENPRAAMGFIIAPFITALFLTSIEYIEYYSHGKQASRSLLYNLLGIFFACGIYAVAVEIIVAIPLLRFFHFLKWHHLASCVLTGIIAGSSPIALLFILSGDISFDQESVKDYSPFPLIGALSGIAFWLAVFYKLNKREVNSYLQNLDKN
jgi:hypothetical protein